MLIIIILLLILLLITWSKYFVYYCTVRGLLYYLGDKYNDMPDERKAKELRDMAIERTIKEFFHMV